MAQTNILVVGAGLAGLAFAHDAQERGSTVRLLDKGRGPGGRAATRRWGGLRLDHGAQYFTARSPRLQKLTDLWRREGWLKVWSDGFPLWDGAVQPRPPGHPRFVPTQGMSQLPKRLAEGLAVETGARVTGLRRDGALWTALCDDGQTFQAERMVLNLPPAQLIPLARDLVDTSPLESVRFNPAWTVLVRLERDLAVDWPALEVKHPALAWVARDHTKRAPGTPPALVVHAAGAWSAAHIEDDPDGVTAAVLAALTDVVGSVAVAETQAHRWRYALPTVTYPHTHFWNEDQTLGWCGDWCDGPRVEGALQSGWALAEAIY